MMNKKLQTIILHFNLSHNISIDIDKKDEINNDNKKKKY